jgi:hypothetical protein
MSSLEERVLRLELTNRRLTRIVFSMGLALGGVFVTGAQHGRAVEPLIRAQRIQLVDAKGELFVDIRNDEGSGVVETYAGVGPTTFLGAAENEAGVTTGLIQAFGPRGNVAVELGAEAPDDNPAGPFSGQVTTFGAHEEPLVHLSEADDGHGLVEVACGENCWQALPPP